MISYFLSSSFWFFDKFYYFVCQVFSSLVYRERKNNQMLWTIVLFSWSYDLRNYSLLCNVIFNGEVKYGVEGGFCTKGSHIRARRLTLSSERLRARIKKGFLVTLVLYRFHSSFKIVNPDFGNFLFLLLLLSLSANFMYSFLYFNLYEPLRNVTRFRGSNENAKK